MFSIGFVELMVIAIVGLLVLGPERLPGALRQTAGWIRAVRRYAASIREELEDHFDDLEKDSVVANLREGRKLFDEAQRDLDRGLRPAAGRGEAGKRKERET